MDRLFSFKFANPEYLWAIPIIAILMIVWWFFNKEKEYATIKISSLNAFKGNSSFRGKLKILLPVFRIVSVVALIVAIARPQTTDSNEKVTSYGIDIVLSLDVSASMLAKDFKPNRLEAAKNVAADFIDARQNDRIGLVIFSGESFTQVPVTTDHRIVKEQLSKIKYGFLAQGTAIGMGIATGVNRLKDSKADSKIIVLMTDGVNNSGLIDPMLATETANQFNIKVYTIGIGSKGQALMPVGIKENGQFKYGYAKGEIDEKLLKEVAKATDGKYFRATGNKSLKEIYAEIDQLEKTEILTSQTIRKTEEFYPFAIFAFFVLVLEMIFRYFIVRSFP